MGEKLSQHNFEQSKQRFGRSVARRLIEVGALLAERHRESLGESYPPASQPGEFPHRRTGLLQTSVDYEPKTADEVIRTGSVKVAYDLDVAPHAQYMSGMDRLGISDTKERIRGELEAVFHREPGF